MNDDSKTVFQGPPSLNLDVDDKKLVEYINEYKKFIKKKKEELKYKDRVETNKRFLYGRQIEDGKYKGVDKQFTLKSYQKPYIDNVIKEGEDQIRALVFSKMPDFIVSQGDREGSEKTAKLLSEAVNKKIRSDSIKKVLQRAFRHHPVYYQGVIKYRWDPTKGKNGDVVFECIHPNNIDIDFSATESGEKHFKVIIHYIEKTIREWIEMFPTKEDEIIKYAKDKGKLEDKETGSESAMAVRIKGEEVWFDWSEKAEDFDPEEPVFNSVNGVLWKLGNEILDKKKNPNWDWEGEDKLFLNGQPIPEELLPQLALLGNQVEGITQETVFRNYFNAPKKPFIFLTYDQWGEVPIDESSRIEENLLLQQNYDIRGMQVTKMIDDAKLKNVFSSLSGMTREDIEKMDLDDPDQDIFVTGDLRQVHNFIVPQQPTGDMFGDLSRSRERILSKVSIHGATRGEIQTSTATTNQIAREQDFVVHDNLSEDTVIAASTEIVQAYIHMMKLRYTPEHFKRLVGSDADETHENLSYDTIEDGMEVEVYASGTDKLKQERQAKEEAQLGLIDPLTYMRDTGRKNPEERAEMLFYFQNAPELYFKKYIEGAEVPDIAEQLQLMNQQRLQQAQGMAQPTAQPGQPPMQPSPQDTTQMATQPQGSNRGLMGVAQNAMNSVFGNNQ